MVDASAEDLRLLVTDCLLPRPSSLPDDHEPLTELGLDSLALMQLVAALYERFGVDTQPDDLRIENFGTVADIARFVAGRTRR